MPQRARSRQSPLKDCRKPSKPQFVGERETVKLSEIAKIKAGNVAPKKDAFTEDGIPFVRAGSLTNLLAGGSLADLEKIDGGTAQKLRLTLFPAGTVVFAKSGMSCMTGNVYVLPKPCYVVSHLACVIPNGNYASYLKHYFRFNRPNRLIENPSFPSIKLSKIQGIELRLPSPEKGVRQVQALERIESQIGQAKALLTYLNSLVKSRFVEMFGDPVYGKRWPSITLAEFCTKLGSGATPRGGKSAYKTEGVPLIRSMNVHNDHFARKDLAYIDDDQAAKLKNVALKKGDVLLNITGASVARSCLCPDDLAGGRVNQHVSIIRADQNRMLPIILNSILINNSYQDFLLKGSMMAGATREAITRGGLEKMTVPLPPLDLQRQFSAFASQVDKSRFVDLGDEGHECTLLVDAWYHEFVTLDYLEAEILLIAPKA